MNAKKLAGLRDQLEVEMRKRGSTLMGLPPPGC
jgi:hypothetical protein